LGHEHRKPRTNTHRPHRLGVAFDPHDGLVAAGSADGKVYVWDAHTGAPRRTIATPAGVTSVAFSPDGRRIASGGDDNLIRLWDTDTGGAAMDALTGHFELRRIRHLHSGWTL
jgi:WD40 repeat protein